MTTDTQINPEHEHQLRVFCHDVLDKIIFLLVQDGKSELDALNLLKKHRAYSTEQQVLAFLHGGTSSECAAWIAKNIK